MNFLSSPNDEGTPSSPRPSLNDTSEQVAFACSLNNEDLDRELTKYALRTAGTPKIDVIGVISIGGGEGGYLPTGTLKKRRMLPRLPHPEFVHPLIPIP